MKKKIKFLIVAGARPNFMKIAPLVKEIKKNKNIDFALVHTGQHYDFLLSEVFFKELDISKPDYNLNVGSGNHAWQTAKIMEKLEPILIKEKPDLIIVVGDVNSTLAGALTASKVGIPVAHIEAGLRSFDKKMPEEINRVLTDHISDFLFCPTKTAINNLKKEGIRKGVYNVGDIMYDTFLNRKAQIPNSKLLEKLKLKPKQYVLLTIHRPSNTDNLKNLKTIIETIAKSKKNIIFPCHPRTKKALKKIKLPEFENLKVINPVGYIEMLVLEKNAQKIVTDSGGIQKEAYWLKVPCITLRENTEWSETLVNGWNFLVGNDKSRIEKQISSNEKPGIQKQFFGNGKAAQKIMKILLKLNGY